MLSSLFFSKQSLQILHFFMTSPKPIYPSSPFSHQSFPIFHFPVASVKSIYSTSAFPIPVLLMPILLILIPVLPIPFPIPIPISYFVWLFCSSLFSVLEEFHVCFPEMFGGREFLEKKFKSWL